MVKCLAQGHNVTAGIRTHILLLTPELESGKLDRSATTLQDRDRALKVDILKQPGPPKIGLDTETGLTTCNTAVCSGSCLPSLP